MCNEAHEWVEARSDTMAAMPSEGEMACPVEIAIPAGDPTRLQNDIFENIKNFRDLGGLATADGKVGQ